MKLTNFLIGGVVGFLTACGAATPSPEPTLPISPVETGPTAQIPEAEVFNSPPVTPSPALGIDPEPGNSPVLSWNRDPQARLISATFCCGHITQVTLLNYIPDALVWGDGRIIWVEPDNEARRVLAGRLSVEQIEALLERMAAAGFFSWQDRYADQSVADAPDQCLSVELENQSKKVCEYFQGAPPAFHELYAEVAGGAGATGADYLPERGYLTAYPLDLPNGFTPPVDAVWPVDSAGFSLAEIGAGRWVEGETLNIAWEMVNAKWRGMIIQESEIYYQLTLQIPGLSYVEPPTQ